MFIVPPRAKKATSNHAKMERQGIFFIIRHFHLGALSSGWADHQSISDPLPSRDNRTIARVVPYQRRAVEALDQIPRVPGKEIVVQSLLGKSISIKSTERRGAGRRCSYVIKDTAREVHSITG